jgi:hypothetical protein
MLKAALASSASRFGQTISNYRSGLIASGFRTWVAWFSHAKLESEITALKFSLDMALNQGRMIALKQVLGRWKNQGLFMGWREWHALYTDAQAERRLNNMLANMSAEERKKALERLNLIITSWLGQNVKYTFGIWQEELAHKKQSEAKFKFAVKKWYKSGLTRGFNAWKYYASLSAEEQAQLEINELKWRLQRSLQTWMKDKFMYEARIFSESQKSRTFQLWKYHTDAVNKTTMRMKMMLGTMKRDKNQQAFRKLSSAVANSKIRAAHALDAKLIAAAKEKALLKMNRIIHHMSNIKLHMGWQSWWEDHQQCKLDKANAKFNLELEAAEAAGYKRGVDEYEPEVLFLREALRRGRASAFEKILSMFFDDAEKRMKTYIMSSWRSFTNDKSGRLEEQKRLAELERLRNALKEAEEEALALKTERSSLKQQIKDLTGDLTSAEIEFGNKIKQMQNDLEAAERKYITEADQHALDNKHNEAMLVNKTRTIEDLQQEMSESDSRHKRQMRRMEEKCNELEVEAVQAEESRKQLIIKTRDLNFKTQGDVSILRENAAKAQQGERRALAEHEVVLSNMKETQGMMQKEKTDNAILTQKVATLTGRLDIMTAEQDALQKRLAKTQALLDAK